MTYRILSILLRITTSRKKNCLPSRNSPVDLLTPRVRICVTHQFFLPTLSSIQHWHNLKHYRLLPENSSYRNKAHKRRLRDTSMFQTAGVQPKGRFQQYLFRIPLFKDHNHIPGKGGGKRSTGRLSQCVTINIVGNQIIIKRYNVQDQSLKVFQSR